MDASVQGNAVACIGAGNIGRAWAIKFAMSGLEVRLHDVSLTALNAARTAIQRSLSQLDPGGTGGDTTASSRITLTTNLHEALAGVHYVQESVFEECALKREVFAELDSICDHDVILASSAGEVPASEFTADLGGRHRCIIAHPTNPPHIIPLVEVVPAPWTSSEVIDRTRTFLTGIGQEVVTLNKEIFGFVLNRLQFALLGEALHLVGEGYCEPDAINRCVKFGLGLRWAFLGPLEVAHLNHSEGFRKYFEVDDEGVRRLCKELRVDYAWDYALMDKITADCEKIWPAANILAAQLGRDQKLLSLRKHFANFESERQRDCPASQGS